MHIVDLKDLDIRLLRLIADLYRDDPLTHAYLLYDVIYESKATEAVFALDGRNRVAGYILMWRGGRRLGVHVWGSADELLDVVTLKGPAVVQLYSDRLVDKVLARLHPSARVEGFVDMVVDEDSFTPWNSGEAVRLKPERAEHVKAFAEFSRARKRFVEGPQELLRKWRYYGVFAEGKLVSVACAYLRMPEVWCIGDVHTLKGYRGRGYAKTVTSAITRDAVLSGATALLHVADGNIAARRVYKALGYRILRTRPWIIV